MSDALRLDDEFAAELMLRHGVPEAAVITLRSVAGNFRAFGAGGTPVDTRLTDGGTLDFAGRPLRVWHRPGHSPTCTIFHDESNGELIGGDHLLGHISSNPLITRGRPRALVDYVASMQATAAMEIERVHPGHGAAFTDVADLVATRLTLHERRARKIARMLDGGPKSAHAIAGEMWGTTAIAQAFLTSARCSGTSSCSPTGARSLRTTQATWCASRTRDGVAPSTRSSA
jgi:glyoxylase-like metal-dependent hydrolase (beta-lactamase superfamily II)